MPIYTTRLAKNFFREQYAIVDNSPTSPDYFNIVYFPDEVGGGKNLIKLTGGPELFRGYEIDAEILDANGDPLDYEFSTITDRYGYKYLSFSVYDNTALGIGTVYLVGVAKNVPIINGNYNVIWSRNIQITPYERNSSELIFDKPALVDVAQVSVATTSLSSSLSPLTNVTSSALTLVQANFKGFDKILAEDSGITDSDYRTLAAGTLTTSVTVNTINTTYRSEDSRISNGFAISEWSRYNTVISASTPIFNSGFLGATMEFVTLGSGSTATASFTAEPDIPVNFSGSIYNTLDLYKATIVDVPNANTIVVDKSLDMVGSISGIPTVFTFTKATDFTASFIYKPNNQTYITSSLINQTFIQFTFADLQPIGGQVNSVRVYYKLSNASSDYKLLTQEFIRPVEYLTDARYINQTGYGQEISKFLLVGHFTTQSIITDYWTFGYENQTDIDIYRTSSLQYSTPLIDSVRLYPSTSRSEFFHTTYYQNYIKGQSYTTTFYTVLDPEVDLEVYMSSTTYRPTLFGDDPFPLAFFNSTDFDKSTGNKGVSRYGKFVGKITNSNKTRTSYGKVGFDFVPDDDGLGRLLIRAIPKTNRSAGYAFISKISITPTVLTGFTPNLVQFTTQAPNEFFTRISQSIDWKISYHDYTGKQSEYETYIPNVPYGLQVDTLGNMCQAEISRNWDFKFPYYALAMSGSGVGVRSTNYWTSSAFPNIPYTNASVYGGFVERPSLYTQRVWPLVVSGSRNQRWQYAISLGAGSGSAALPTQYSSYWNTQIPTVLGIDNFTTVPQTTTWTSIYTESAQGDAAQGMITSSWRWTDQFYINFNYTGSPSTLNQFAATYLNFAYGPYVSSSIDNRPFNAVGFVGITKTDVSNSFASQSRNLGSRDDNLRNRTEALKKRKLLWPVNGPLSASYFTENGGIYNVKFKIARTGSYAPDSGSYLMVYIFNANTPLVNDDPFPGSKGFRPPDANIVKIGNGYNSGSVSTPILSWYNEAENTYYEQYDINLIQWGTPAQLVFEPAYTTTNTAPFSASFGCLITDISFCKIGVTTDPTYLKPQNFQEYVTPFYSNIRVNNPIRNPISSFG